MWPESQYFLVLAAVCVIPFTIVYALWRRFHNVAGRETESQHEINVDTCIPATLLKHAKACKRNIHEVPRDDNSLFSALADQLTGATFTGQSLRDHIETFISDRWPSEQHKSFLLSNPNSRQDTRPTIQDAADFLRHNIVLYRDDDNPPFLIQPNVDGPDPIFLHIGCINNKYYVSFRPHGYKQGQGASVLENTDSDEDRSDTDSENVNSFRVAYDRTMINIGDNNQTTVVADAEESTSVKSISYGNNNHVTLKIIVPKKDNTFVDEMINSGSCVGDKGICLKISISGMSQEELERAERNVIEHKHKIKDDINAEIKSDGVKLKTLRPGCLLMFFRPKSWLNCRAFIMGLHLHNEKYIDIFRQLLTAFQHINDSINLTMDVKISIGQLSEGTNVSDCISGTAFKDIVQARDMDKTPQPFEKKDVGKKQTTTDQRSGRSVGKDDTLSLKVDVRPVGDKSSLSSTDLEKVAMTTEQVLEFKEADVPYIPHTKTHDRMTTEDMQKVRDLLRKVHMNMYDPDTVAGENVLLLGLSGAGKSSILNTLNSALTGKYRPWLRAGQGGGQTNTIELIRFPKCGVREADLRDQEDDLLRDMLPKLPNFYDFAGLSDDDNDQLREILRLVIFGYIPENTDYRELEKIQKEYPDDKFALRTFYDTPQKEQAITSIVFVHSHNVQVPTKLINCLQSVLKEADSNTAGLKYTGKVFVAVTKQDLIDSRPPDYSSIEVLGATDPNNGQSDILYKRTNVDNQPVQPVSPHFLQTRSIKDQLAVLFDMHGAMGFTIVELTNYTDVTDYEFDSEIVKRHLDFLYKVTIPKLQRGKPKNVVTQVKQMKRAMLHALRSFYEAPRRLREARLHENRMIIIIVVAVLACFLGYSLSKLTLQHPSAAPMK